MKLRTLALPALIAGTLVLSGAATAGRTQIYAKGVPVCEAPKNLATAHRVTCDAMRRVLVTPGTPGAEPLAAAAGGATTTGPSGGLTPGDLTGVYGLSGTGSGQTVAIVDAYNDPKIDADLQTFDSRYGLATCSLGNGCLTVVNQSGGSNLPANDTSGWSVEESLDVESVHAVCSACKIVLVEANSASDSDLAAAENTAATTVHATEISNSFGEPETGARPTFASAFDHPGVVITASSGDDGYYDFDYLGRHGRVSVPSIPAAYSTVVAVGGTSLFLSQSSTPTRSYETVWNDNGPQDAYQHALQSPLGASGGGCSTLFAAPAWQAQTSGYSSATCGGRRLVADVSMVADPLTGFDVYDSYSGCYGCTAGWQTIGGTSLSAPLVAAAFAVAGGAGSLPYPAVSLYSHPASAHYDVTVGGNGFCGGEAAAQCPDYNTGGAFDLGDGIVDCAYDGTGKPAAGTGACDAAPGFDGPANESAHPLLRPSSPLPGSRWPRSADRRRPRTEPPPSGRPPSPTLPPGARSPASGAGATGHPPPPAAAHPSATPTPSPARRRSP
jgi:hypothetical protein